MGRKKTGIDSEFVEYLREEDKKLYQEYLEMRYGKKIH